jgi:hypothetical protein
MLFDFCKFVGFLFLFDAKIVPMKKQPFWPRVNGNFFLIFRLKIQQI